MLHYTRLFYEITNTHPYYIYNDFYKLLIIKSSYFLAKRPLIDPIRRVQLRYRIRISCWLLVKNSWWGLWIAGKTEREPTRELVQTCSRAEWISKYLYNRVVAPQIKTDGQNFVRISCLVKLYFWWSSSKHLIHRVH